LFFWGRGEGHGQGSAHRGFFFRKGGTTRKGEGDPEMVLGGRGGGKTYEVKAASPSRESFFPVRFWGKNLVYTSEREGGNIF